MAEISRRKVVFWASAGSNALAAYYGYSYMRTNHPASFRDVFWNKIV